MSNLSHLYPQWEVEIIAPANQQEAIDAFLRMARADSKAGDIEPTIRVKNYSAPASKPYRVRFSLRDPNPKEGKEGDHDHVLFKAKGDGPNRTHKGQRRPQDYQEDRAKRVPFIPLVLSNPQFVYRIRKEPMKVFYVCQTGSDEWFVVLLCELRGNPRFNFITAYTMTDAEYKSERPEWERVFPKTPKQPRKKRKM